MSNIAVSVQFLVSGNVRYHFGLGLTDQTGCVKASYSDFEEHRRKNTKLDEVDSTVRILIESDQELRKRDDYARRVFKESSPWWGNGWPLNAVIKPQERIVELGDGTTMVQIHTEPAQESAD